MNDGFTQDELLAIGTRRVSLNLPMSATDINRSIPFEVSQLAISRMTGFTEAELKAVGEGKANIIDVPARDVSNQPLAGIPQNVQDELDKLEKFLGNRGMRIR